MHGLLMLEGRERIEQIWGLRKLGVGERKLDTAAVGKKLVAIYSHPLLKTVSDIVPHRGKPNKHALHRFYKHLTREIFAADWRCGICLLLYLERRL